MNDIEQLKEKYRALGEEIERLEESKLDHGKLAEVMPRGVLCNATDCREIMGVVYRKFKAVDRTYQFPYMADGSGYLYIHFPTRPMLPWLGESSRPPVHPNAQIRVWFKNKRSCICTAKMHRWAWINDPYDIVAYQVEGWVGECPENHGAPGTQPEDPGYKDSGE